MNSQLTVLETSHFKFVFDDELTLVLPSSKNVSTMLMCVASLLLEFYGLYALIITMPQPKQAIFNVLIKEQHEKETAKQFI